MCLGLCALLLAPSVTARAQQPGRLARVGVLISGSSITTANTEAFRQRLRELGYVEGHLPVQQPTKFELVINLKTAKQIGLTIPASVLARADRVIK
jgi:ABC-type uncharacterized transport system substrate-binding protein